MLLVILQKSILWGRLVHVMDGVSQPWGTSQSSHREGSENRKPKQLLAIAPNKKGLLL
jgi:hypothetical protein